MKLGKRLTQLEAMVAPGYHHIWDCCCDHGLLGAALLARQAAPHIHFVDIVPELMRELEQKLAHFFPTSSPVTDKLHSQWQVHCMDVAALPLQTLNGKHLVIIAGVGGDLILELVQAIYKQNPTAELDFLLSPVHHLYNLRQQLIRYGFSLKQEVLLLENQRFYELLYVSTQRANPHNPISPVGSQLWQANTPGQAKIATAYLHKTLEHYRRMQLSQGVAVQHIIDAYGAVVIPHVV